MMKFRSFLLWGLVSVLAACGGSGGEATARWSAPLLLPQGASPEEGGATFLRMKPDLGGGIVLEWQAGIRDGGLYHRDAGGRWQALPAPPVRLADWTVAQSGPGSSLGFVPERYAAPFTGLRVSDFTGSGWTPPQALPTRAQLSNTRSLLNPFDLLVAGRLGLQLFTQGDTDPDEHAAVALFDGTSWEAPVELPLLLTPGRVAPETAALLPDGRAMVMWWQAAAAGGLLRTYHTRTPSGGWKGPFSVDDLTGALPNEVRPELYAGRDGVFMMYVTAANPHEILLRRYDFGAGWQPAELLGDQPQLPGNTLRPWRLVEGPRGERMAMWLEIRALPDGAFSARFVTRYFSPHAGWSPPSELPGADTSFMALRMNDDGTVLAAYDRGVYQFSPERGWQKRADAPAGVSAGRYAIDAQGRVTVAYLQAGSLYTASLQ